MKWDHSYVLFVVLVVMVQWIEIHIHAKCVVEVKNTEVVNVPNPPIIHVVFVLNHLIQSQSKHFLIKMNHFS